jgi:glycosyltransferase involved in cell wall biosynthesis
LKTALGSISAIVITRNEESNIAACLASLSWVDEIIVVDSGSTDKTVSIAKRFTKRVFPRAWEGFGAARNFAIAKATSDWILWVDADERVTTDLLTEIQAVIHGGAQANAYSLPRKANFLGRWILHCGWYPGRVVRLFRKGTGRFTEHRVHERLEVQGHVGQLRSDLLHFTDPNLFHYFEKFNRYTSLAAEELVADGKAFGLWQLVAKPWWMFIRMFILRRGYLDGVQGFILCVVSACYVFTKYAKLWERQSKGATNHE